MHPELREEEIEALLEIGYVYYFLERNSLAVDYTQRGLRLARKSGKRAQIASAVNLLDAIDEREGRYDPALQRFDSALQIRRALNDIHGQSATLGNIGLLMERSATLPRRWTTS